MKSENLKLELIQWLVSLEDKSAIQSLFHFKTIQESTDWWDDLTEEQRLEIEKSFRQARAGNSVSSSDVWKKYGRNARR